MSSVVSKRNVVVKTNAKSVAAKPYCGTCHKAGKPIEEYTNHWTRSSRDANAIVTCPLILATVCTYCSKTGHWKKYCPAISSKKMTTQKETNIAKTSVVANDFQVVGKKKSKSVVAATPAVSTNRYASLLQESVQEEPVEPVVIPVVKSSVSSWASIVKQDPLARPIVAVVASPKPIEIMPMPVVVSLEKAHKIDWAMMMKQTIEKETKLASVVVLEKKLPYLELPPVMKNRSHYKKYTNWADCESSDDEDDEEDLAEFEEDEFQQEYVVYA